MSVADNIQAVGNIRQEVSDLIRVMIVDDSAVIRGLTRRMLEDDSLLSVVSSVSDGEQAVKAIKSIDVDVVVLESLTRN